MVGVRPLLTWPKRRRLGELNAELSPGRLLLTRDDGSVVVDCQNTDELRAFAMMVYVAAIELDLLTQHTAAVESAARRQRRKLAGLPNGLRHRPFVEPPEPAAFMEA